MKTSLLLFLLVFTLTSCNTDSDENSTEDLVVLEMNDIYGEWKLVLMSGSIPNSETTDDQMEWQESYNFKSDGTFTKIRESNGSVTKAAGTFTIDEYSNTRVDELTDFYINLAFTSGKEIVSSCNSQQNIEHLFFRNNRMVSSSNACDGPGLEYEKYK